MMQYYELGKIDNDGFLGDITEFLSKEGPKTIILNSEGGIMDDAYMLMSLINTNHANELECIVLHSASSANILLFGCKWSKVLYCHTSEIIHHLSSRETTLYEGGKFHWMAKVRESHPMNDVRQEIESYISDSGIERHGEDSACLLRGSDLSNMLNILCREDVEVVKMD